VLIRVSLQQKVHVPTMKELTILMPCLNEAKTLSDCIKLAQDLLQKNGIDGEILISDNGSTDGSQTIARALGARVVECPVRGYGAALQYGIEHSEGMFVLMGDSDRSYHFDEAMPMIEKLRAGYDVCMGSRLKGRIMPNAMPFLNRYFGNPVLTAIGRAFFNIRMSDFHCGMRAFRKDKVMTLDLVTTGMEWASEMVIKSALSGFRMTEMPITLYQDGRVHPPHMKRWRDGWRHLRFMLLHSPFWLFIAPGLSMIVLGTAGQVVLSRGMVRVGSAYLDVHSLLVLSFLVVLGAQAVFAGLFARLYSTLHGILPYDSKFDRSIRKLTLEKLLIVSLLLFVIGFTGFLRTLLGWYEVHFSSLNYQTTMRRLIPALTLMAVAVQGVLNGFMLSVLFLKSKKSVDVRP
jgi:glycosyltransferase involved in cell wall biosynthesis